MVVTNVFGAVITTVDESAQATRSFQPLLTIGNGWPGGPRLR